jgi:hypothetical protein
MSSTNKWQPDSSKLAIVHMNFIANIILAVVGICFLAELSGYKVIAKICKHKVICIMVGLLIAASLILLIVNRNFYLPFLGWTVYPCGSLAEKIPTNANTKVIVHVQPNVNVIYWASEPTDITNQPVSNPWDAYANYENSGVVRSDASGKAILQVRTPSSYNVGIMNRTLKAHVHYRVCGDPGMLGEVKTAYA